MATPVSDKGSLSVNSSDTSEHGAKFIEDLITSEGETLSAMKYERVLEKRIAYFSGAMFKGCPILCFPSSGLRHLEGEPPQWDELDSTLLYMKSLLSSDQLTTGIVMLVDGRRPNQSQIVKHLLEKISCDVFPLRCHTLFLLKASHLSQLSNFTYYFSKQKAKLASAEVKEKINIVSIKDKDDLFEHLPPNQLTEDFNGTLQYNHQQWFKNAVIYEKVQKLREKILVKFPDVRDGLNQFEIPQSVKDAERLMQQHLKLKEFFVNLFAEIDVLIDELTSNLEEGATNSSVGGAIGALPSTEVLSYLNSTNEEVREEQAEFEKFWSSHKQRLDHMMKVCHYKRSLAKVRKLMQGHIDDMTDSRITIGEALESALELGEKHENFVTTCKETMDGHLKDIREESVELCNLPASIDVNTRDMLLQSTEGVKQGANSLTELYQSLMKLCQQKRDLYIVAVKFHMTAKQCDQWCASVKEFTEYPPEPDTTSSERAGEQIDQTESLMKQMSQKNVNTLRDLASCLPEKDVKKLLTKTLQKCNNNREKLEEYRKKLLQIIALSYTPPTPPQSSYKEQSTNSMSSSLSLSTSSALPSPGTPNKAPHPLASIMSTAGSLSDSDKMDGLQQSGEYVDEEGDPAILRKREFIYKEIIATEKDYIADLKIILDSYYYEMDSDDRVPLRLRGKRGVVFGNLEQIYEFHNDVFLKQVEFYSDHPERVGTCFIQHSKEFQLYSEYCRIRPNSEALLTQSPECQSFFKEIQIRLAHQLPLNSYLIKPIQRVTKYQLLLKDMVKHSSNAGQALFDLKTALDMMLQVLRNLNDSLHVVGLKGFPGALSEQGRLLVHDPFQMWEGQVNSRHLLSRNHDRHVFLFEKVIIFTKKKEESSNQQKKENRGDAYFYKSHLHLSDVQIKELPDDGPLVFELALIGGNRLTRLHASSKEIKTMWVSELRRLLSNQFGLLKDMVIQSGTLDRATAERFAKSRTGNSRNKSKIFSDALPRELEPKKSFSERFKLNIRAKKKSDPDVKPTSPLSKTTTPITASLGGNSKLKVRDDNALVISVPAHETRRLKGRTKSHDNLLDDKNGIDFQTPSEVGVSGGVVRQQRSFDEEEWSGDEEDSSVGAREQFEILAPGVPRFYTATENYDPSDEDNGVQLTKGQEIELIGINQYSGWWLVRSCNYYSNDEVEGWVPASFLQISEFSN